MALVAADINDAEIAVLSADRVFYREPGIALLDDDGLVVGKEAAANARIQPRRIQANYWSSLSTEPLQDVRFQHLSSADLVSRQLETIWQAVGNDGDRLVLAIPGTFSSEQLALLLGILKSMDVAVVAMVDSAVAATRRQYNNAALLHVDIGLHDTVVSRLRQDGHVQLESRRVAEGSGMLVLQDLWIRAIAELFVQQSRFDPLHTAETEQSLLDSLPAWLREAAVKPAVSASVDYKGASYAAEIDALGLIAAAAPVYQRILSQLRTLIRANEVPAIQLTGVASALPGLAELLKARVGGELFLLEPGAAARGLIARCRAMPVAEQVSLLRQLPWDQAAAEVDVVETESSGQTPTHVLFNHRAHAIGEAAFDIGSAGDNGQHALGFDESMPGLSRRHCTLQRVNGQCVVQDHSRYGTFLNGHRIEDSAVLEVGDFLRVGTPGFELQMIRVEQDGGA